MKKCDCNGCDVQSKISFVDYDSLIEELQDTRDKIDNLITILEHKKLKDDAINQILSSNYDEDEEQQEKDDDKLMEILEKILQEIANRNTTYYYKNPYTWWNTEKWKDYPRYYTTSSWSTKLPKR